MKTKISTPVFNKFDKLEWSVPIQLEDVRNNKALIPGYPGVYAFTSYEKSLNKNYGILYIGKAKSLKKRLSTYLSSPDNILLLSPRKKDNKLSRSLRHTGKNLLLMEIQQKSRNGRSGIWLRWLKDSNPSYLERNLIVYYEPAFNISLNPRVGVKNT